MIGWRALTDTELIFLVLAAMYLSECVCWLPGEAVCLSSAFGRYRFLRSLPPFKNERGQLVLANPAPFASSFICEPWPIVMDATGIVVPAGYRSGGKQSALPAWLPYDEVRSVSTDGRAILVNRTTMASLATETHAKFVAEKLRAVCDANESDRPQVIEAILDEMTDIAAISERLLVFRQMILPLRISCTVLAVHTFVVGPLLYYVRQFAWWHFAWLYLAGFLACWLFLVFQYRKVHQAIRNETRGARVWHLLLSPASSMRAAEALSRDLLAGSEPVAAAAALCSAVGFAPYAGATLRSAIYPTSGDQAIAGTVASDARSWFNNLRAARLRRAIQYAGVDADAFLHEPDDVGDAASFCPRCLTLYTIGEGSCSECPGVLLRPFTNRMGSHAIGTARPGK